MMSTSSSSSQPPLPSPSAIAFAFRTVFTFPSPSCRYLLCTSCRPGTVLISYRSGFSNRQLSAVAQVGAAADIDNPAAGGKSAGPTYSKGPSYAEQQQNKLAIQAGKQLSSSMLPLANTRQMTVLPNPDLVGAAEAGGMDFTKATGSKKVQEAPFDDRHTMASAGSFNTFAPITYDPDGIRVAAGTMRRFRGMLDDMKDSEEDRGIMKALAEKKKVARETIAGIRGEIRTVVGRSVGEGADGGRASGPRPGTGTGTGTGTRAPVPISESSALAAVQGTARLVMPRTQRAAFKEVKRASGIGDSIIGILILDRKFTMKATMIASKWARIVQVNHGTLASDPVAMQLELQRTFYPSFLADVDDITGGEFSFETEAEPSSYLANIGHLNQLVHGGDPHEIPQVAAPADILPRSYFVNTNPAPRFALAMGGSGKGLEPLKAVSGAAAFRARVADSATGAIVPYGAGGGGAGGGGGTQHSYDPVLKTYGNESARLVEKRTLHQEKPLIWKGERIPDRFIYEFEEMKEYRDDTKKALGKKLHKLAKKNEAKAIVKLLTEGEPVLYDPRPWYLRGEGFKQKGAPGARSDSDASGGGGGRAAGLLKDGESTPGGGGTLSAGGSYANSSALELLESAKAKKNAAPVNPYLVPHPEVREKPEVDWSDDKGVTALMVACENSSADAVIVLLRLGANPHRPDHSGKRCLDYAMEASQVAAEALKLRKAGSVELKKAANDVQKYLDTRSLFEAVKDGDLKKVRHYLDTQGLSVNTQNEYGMTPLHFAVMARNTEMIEFLMRNGADRHAKNNLGQTPRTLIEDYDTREEKDVLLDAMDVGLKEDRARRAKLAHKRALKLEEERLLKEFRTKLRTLTRGTTAAKTLRALAAAAMPQDKLDKLAADAAADDEAHRNNDVRAMPTGAEGGGAGGASRPVSRAKTPAGGAGKKNVAVVGGGMATIYSKDHIGLYDDSAGRHARDFVAISRKEQDRVAAKANKKGDAAGGAGGAKAHASTSMATSSNFTQAAFDEFAHAPAPHVESRAFGVWSKNLVGTRA